MDRSGRRYVAGWRPGKRIETGSKRTVCDQRAMKTWQGVSRSWSFLGGGLLELMRVAPAWIRICLSLFFFTAKSSSSLTA